MEQKEAPSDDERTWQFGTSDDDESQVATKPVTAAEPKPFIGIKATRIIKLDVT